MCWILTFKAPGIVQSQQDRTQPRFVLLYFNQELYSITKLIYISIYAWNEIIFF